MEITTEFKEDDRLHLIKVEVVADDYAVMDDDQIVKEL